MPYRPHLVSSTTRPIVRSLVQKVFGDFDPLRLDPYLFFDAATSMVGTLENPTLDLDPSKPDTLDVITATRAGTATFTNANGLIASASPNTVRVDQTQGAELTPTVYQNIGYTDFSSGWTAEGGTLTDSQTQAPDGTTPVYELTENTGTSRHRLFDSGIPLVAGQDYTVSAYVKKVSSGRFFLINSSALNGIKGFLNLDTGVATLTSGTGTIAVTNEGDDWYRLSVTAQATTTNGFVYMQLQNAETDVNYTGTGASMLIWGPQFEEGTTASDFVANTSGNPKFITGATFGPRVPMILVEPSATNLLPYSEDFSNSAWTKNNVTLTADYGIAPDGTNTSTRIQYSGSSYILDSFAVSDYTVSAFVKGVAGQVVRFGIGANVAGGADFTLSGEWQRIEHTGSGGTIFFSTFGGNTATDFEIWGAQVETGSVATSYIPTSGSTVTRAADDLVISGSAFSSFYNASEGTVYTEAVGRGYFDFNSVFAISDNTFNESIYQRTPSNNQVLVVIDGGNVQASLGSSTTPTGTLVRRAASFKLNNFKGSHDGVDTNSDTSGTIPTVDRLYVGASASAQNKLNGHIKRLIYWPYHSDSL